MVRVEYLVVGCGLAGRAVAERIAGLEPGAALLQVGGDASTGRGLVVIHVAGGKA